MLALSTIELEGSNHILEVTLSRQARCNAINSVMMQELLQLWQWLPTQPAWRCVILTGKGPKAFCAGADLKERKDLDIATWKQQHAVLQQAMQAMSVCPVPIIAAVNGAAFGGGLELTLASDYAYAADHAVFSQSEVKLGIMPGAMGTQHLPRAVGVRRAKELTFTGQSFNAEQALQWGMLNKVLPGAKLMEAAGASAQLIVANAPLAVVQSKQSLNHAACRHLLEGYQFEVDCYNRLLDTADRVEGIAAFNEKRQPEFTGE